jgi:hypothetical protein
MTGPNGRVLNGNGIEGSAAGLSAGKTLNVWMESLVSNPKNNHPK